MTGFTAYHPLNALKPVVENVWVVDARIPNSYFEMPIRMTVIRLPGGNLLLHSPRPTIVLCMTNSRSWAPFGTW